MTESIQTWHDLVSGSSMDDIEEGLLDDTNNTPQKLHGKSTAFLGKTEHDWKELVSEPSLSMGEITMSDNNKSESQGSDVKREIGHKDWDQYLSAFSLNDGDSRQFMALEVHTDGGQDMKNFVTGITERSNVKEKKLSTREIEVGPNVTLPEVSSIVGEENLVTTQTGLSQNMQQQSSSINNSYILEDAAFCTTSKSVVLEQNLASPKFAWTSKKESPDGGNSYGTPRTVVRPDSAPVGGDSDAARGFPETSKSTGRPSSAPLKSSAKVKQVDKTDWQISNTSALWQTKPIIWPSTVPVRDVIGLGVERNVPVLPKDISQAPNTVNMLNTCRNLSSTKTNVLSKINGRSSEKNTLEMRPRSALDTHLYFLPKQSSSIPRANSAPLWQDTDTNKQASSLGLVSISASDFQTQESSNLIHQMGYAHPKEGNRIDSWENSLEQRKISGADEEILHKSQPFSKSSSTTNATGIASESTLLELRRQRPEYVMTGNSDPLGKLKETNIETELELKRPLDDGNRLFVAGNVSEVRGDNEETDSGLRAALRFNINSSDIQTSTVNTLAHSERSPETSNVAPSRREAAENLPIRPLTIGNSLTKGSSLAYRPVSPFQPDLYPTSTASSIAMTTSTTSIAPTYLSASQYSEGTLDTEGEDGRDMSARERLQPLGRDGLEVKQGPPWGITMPLFQPDSRNSSLSSNDSGLSNASNSQYFQLQATASEQSKLDTEPLQSASSTTLETDLSRKASIKSLEPKEPVGVNMLNGAGILRTPVAKFHHLNTANFNGDSPVSKILGPTFKATQKMLEELQRRPLGAYDDDKEPLEKIATDATAKKYESEMSVEKGTVGTEEKLGNGSYVGPESDVRKESSQMEGSKSTQDGRDSVDSKLSRDGRPSGERSEKPARDSYRQVSSNQPILDLTPTTTMDIAAVNNTHRPPVDDPQRKQENRSSMEEIEKPSKDSLHEVSTNHSVLNFTPITTGNVELDNYTRSPVLSQKANNLHGGVNDVVGSHSPRNERHKTSGLTDSTLGNSIRLSGHLKPAEVEKKIEGVATRNSDPKSLSWDNLLENRKDESDMSEFDRVASESISWSNAVANQFREEIKSVDLEVKKRLHEPEGDKTLVREPRTTTPILDSGLSESSTNDDIYRPKGLPRLFDDNGPIGIYDVRRSSGPGSTNRKRFALGRKPRDSYLSLPMGGIYVSDGTTGTSGTDRDNQLKSRQSRYPKDSRIHRRVYVSEGTTSGTEVVINEIDSEPEGQSTPKSEDISARQSSGLASNVREVSAKENDKPLVARYLGLSNFEFENPSRTLPVFTTYEIEKPSRQPPSAFMSYKGEKQSKVDPPAFSTFEIDKPMRANPPESSRYGIEVRGSSFGTGVSNVMQLQPTAKVEHTWSISKPVMSQLSMKTAPLVIHESDRDPRNTTKQQPLTKLKQSTTRPPDHRQKRAPQHRETVAKSVQQHLKDRSSESGEIADKNGTTQRKKSVADIILENMIHEEQEQKKRRKKLEVKQEQTSQDLNQLWERFQEVVGKKSRTSRNSRMSRVVRAQPSRETSSTDISVASSSDRKIGGHSIDISTDSDEEFQRFLSRIRQIQSSESTSYLDDNGSMTSQPSSSNVPSVPVKHVQQETTTTPSERSHRKSHPKAVDSSTSMTSVATSDDRHVRRNPSQNTGWSTRKTARPNVHSPVPVVVSSSVTDRESEIPVSLPMWLGVKNKEVLKKGRTSSSCTCGAKSRKEKAKTSEVRDIGVNCPTPPIDQQDLLPIASDIDMLKAGRLEEGISNPAPASLVRLSLQDAFMYSKHNFIEKSRERVKKVREKREERQSDKASSPRVVVVVPSEKTKPRKEKRKPEENRMMDITQKQQFEQLLKKKPRSMNPKEIRDVNKRMYKNLPEVRKKRDEERRAEFYRTNRLRAQLYGKHVRNTNRIFTAA